MDAPTRSTDGMVATSHARASEAGAATLRRGGSAVDAAIAANAVLAVCYPHMCGLGGDAFWLIHDPKTGRVEGLEGAGPAARAATIAYYRDRGVRTSIPARGPLAALTVPGAIDSWRIAHARYGKLDWASLFTDAIAAARDGVAKARSLASGISAVGGELAASPGMAEIYLRQGALKNPALAATLGTIAHDGARAFYEGDIARRICAAVASRGGPLAPEDFAAYRADWVEPISTGYRDLVFHEMPPPTQGVAPLAAANLLEGFDVAAMGEGTAAHFHHMVEAVKLAYADRDAFVTDPKFEDVPTVEMIDKGYAAKRRALIDPTRALTDIEVKPGIAARPSTRRVPSGGTAYFCTADRDGMTVSIIQSLYYEFGSTVLGGDTGVVLQNRGSFFALDEDHPNCLAPGKRTFHTLIPAMLTKNGKPWAVLGSMGGEGQPQTHISLLTRMVDFGLDPQAAISAPRYLLGRTWGAATSAMILESRVPGDVLRVLGRMGHPVSRAGAWEEVMGHAQAIRILDDGSFEGGADPRGDGAAATA